jgi:cell wall-associated NlpC family hydrolase
VTGARLEFAAAAEGLVGVPFRFRGRDPETGLDCVGLVGAALDAIGRPSPAMARYTMRQTDFAPQLARAELAGFAGARGPIRPGDVLLVQPGPAQIHLLVVGPSGSLVHAHAGLGKVVVTPPPSPWPVARHWRLRTD